MDSKKRLEVAFADSFIPLALNKFEEDRTDYRLGKFLQQKTTVLRRSGYRAASDWRHPHHAQAIIRPAFHNMCPAAAP